MTNLTFFIYFIPILSGILLCVNLLFAPHNPYEEKKSSFECGFHSFLGQNRIQFSISFFIFALLFLLFDLEILLIYPYSVSQYTNEIYGLTIMIIFFILLTIGFCFEFGKKGLKIDSKQLFKNNYLSRVEDKSLIIYKNPNKKQSHNIINKISPHLSKCTHYIIGGMSVIFWYDPQVVTSLVDNWMNSINLADLAKAVGLNGNEVNYPKFDWPIPKTMAEYKSIMLSHSQYLPYIPFFHDPSNLHYIHKMLGFSTPMLATILSYNLPNILPSITNILSNGWTSINSLLETLNFFLARTHINITVFMQSGSDVSMDGDSSNYDSDVDQINAQFQGSIWSTINSTSSELDNIGRHIIATIRANFPNEESFTDINSLILERIEEAFTLHDTNEANSFYINVYNNIFNNNTIDLPSETVNLSQLITEVDFDILNAYSLLANSTNADVDFSYLAGQLESIRIHYMIYKIILDNIG